MYFKTFKFSLLAVAVSSSVLGCGEFLKGKKPESEVIEFADTRFVCLQSVPSQIKKLSIGEAQEKEIRDGFDCLAEALRYFNKRTFGALEGAYTTEEMRNFFGKYFLKENNVSPEFAAELMKIKRALLGGSLTSITKEEIQQLIGLLGVVRDEFVDLAPYMKVYLLQAPDKNADWNQVSAATEQLRRSLQRLLDKMEIADSDYGFEDAKKALAGFADFIKGPQSFAPYERYSTWVPAIEAVKNVLMGKRAHFVDLYQWKDSLNTLLDLYELSLRYHYALRDLKFDNAEKVRQGSQFLDHALKLLLNSHQMKSTGLIPVEDLDYLIDQVVPLVDLKISKRAMKTTYRSLLVRILNPEPGGDVRALMGLEKKHLLTLQRELNIFRLQQSFIDYVTLTTEDRGVTSAEFYQAYLKFNKVPVIENVLSDDPMEQRALLLAWQDLGDLLKSPVPLMLNKENRLVIDSNQRQRKQNWMSLTQANLMRALSRFLLLGYGENTQGLLSRASMSKSGLILWYDDFQEIGLELKAFDPRSANSGARSFLEANFFTFSGNGDDKMDQAETFEFVSTLFSAGLGISEDLRSHMMAAKCGINQLDIFGYSYIKENCFKQHLRQHMGLYFNNLPGMVRYVNSLSQAQWDQFFDYIASASLVENQKRGFIETANIRSMVMILHYIEAVMVLYDKDLNQGLSLDEVYAAAPRFMSFFRTVSDTKYETILKEGFAYLVFKGTIPTATELAGFQFSKIWGLEDAQRMEIARLFGNLKDQMNRGSK